MRFVTLLKYTAQGVSKIKQSPTRAKKFQTQAKLAGVSIESLLWTQGEYDGIILFEAPDANTAAALMLDLAGNGNVQTQTMLAFDATEMTSIVAKTGKR